MCFRSQTTMASFAASINDVVKTCDHVSVEKLMMSGAAETHAKVCSVNLAQVAAGMTSLPTSSALAADDCVATMIPNLDALCAGAVTATLTASAALAGAFTLINAACRSKGWYAQAPPGVTPSNVGSNRKVVAGEGGGFRRLGEVAEEAEAVSPVAPPRQLLSVAARAFWRLGAPRKWRTSHGPLRPWSWTSTMRPAQMGMGSALPRTCSRGVSTRAVGSTNCQWACATCTCPRLWSTSSSS